MMFLLSTLAMLLAGVNAKPRAITQFPAAGGGGGGGGGGPAVDYYHLEGYENFKGWKIYTRYNVDKAGDKDDEKIATGVGDYFADVGTMQTELLAAARHADDPAGRVKGIFIHYFRREKELFPNKKKDDLCIGFSHRAESAYLTARAAAGADALTAQEKVYLYSGYSEAAKEGFNTARDLCNQSVDAMKPFAVALACDSLYHGIGTARVCFKLNEHATCGRRDWMVPNGTSILDTLLTFEGGEDQMNVFEGQLDDLFQHGCTDGGGPEANLDTSNCGSCANHIVAGKIRVREFDNAGVPKTYNTQAELLPLIRTSRAASKVKCVAAEAARRRRRRR